MSSPVSNTTVALGCVVLVVLLYGPGLLIGSVTPLRGWTLVGTAPLLSFGIVGIVAPFTDGDPISWGWGTLVLASLAAAALVALLRRFTSGWTWRRPSRPQVPTVPALLVAGAPAVGVVFAGVAGFSLVYSASSGLRGFPQWWDSTFHANAIQYISETGAADPSALRAVNFPELQSFYYPNAYHCVGALVHTSTGMPIQAVLNLMNALSPLLFAASLVTLVVQCGGGRLLAFVTAVVSGAVSSALFDIMVWGPLFPYVVALAVLPALPALADSVITPPFRPAASVALGIAGVGLIALHPGAAIAGALAGLALLISRCAHDRLPVVQATQGVAVATLTVLVLGLPQVRGFTQGAGSATIDWPGETPPATALGSLLLQDQARDFPLWWVFALFVIGLVNIRKLARINFFLAYCAFFAVLYLMASSYEGAAVALLTRPWWNDDWRLLALATPGLIVLASFGLVTVARWAEYLMRRLAQRLGRRRETTSRAVVLGVGTWTVVGVLVLGVLTEGFYRSGNEERVAGLYGAGPSVTREKLEAYTVLGDLVPPGSLVMNDPQDGSPWMWAFAGVRPVFGHALILPTEEESLGPDRLHLLESFNTYDTNPAVREIAAKLNVSYVIVGGGFIDSGLSRAPGLQDLDTVAALRPVYSNRGATIYELADRTAS